MLNGLSGIRRPARVRVASFGADLTGWPPYRVARDADVVRTFQTMRLLTRLSVLDNVLVAADAIDPRLERRLLRLRRVAHQMNLVSAVCDRLTVLDFGRVICEGPSREVVHDVRVVHACLGKSGAAT